MKKSFILFLLLFSCNQNKNDSNIVNSKIQYYLKNTENNKFTDKEKLKNNDFAFSLLQKEKNSKFTRESLLKIANVYYKFYEDQKLKTVLDKSLNFSLNAKDTNSIAHSYNYYGKYYFDINNADSSFFYFKRAEKLFLKINDSISLIDNYLNISLLNYHTNDYLGVEIAATKALIYNRFKKNERKNFDAYILIAGSSNENKNYKNALVYHKKALKLIELKAFVNSESEYSKSNNNLGYVYQNLNEHKTAIEYFEKGLSQKNLLTDNPSLFCMLIDNYAYSKFKLKDFSNLPDLFYKSLKIREEDNLNQGIIISKIHLSEYYSYFKDTIKAQKFAKEALQLAKTTRVSGDILASLKQLSVVDSKNTSYNNEYIQLSDSLQLAERQTRDRFARIAYETDEVIAEKTVVESQNKTLLYYLLATILLASMVIVIRNQRAKNIALAYKEEQQQTNKTIYNLMISQEEKAEEIRQREQLKMARELHDGVLSRMFGTRMNLDNLNEQSGEENVKKRAFFINDLKEIEKEIREMSHNLSAVNQKFNNFVQIVVNLLEEQKQTHKVDVVYSIDKEINWNLIENETKINLFRILQESLQNTNKYANATQIDVAFLTEENFLQLTYQDNGDGFDVNKKKKGIGLKNMYGRAEESNGKLEITSEIGKGTQLKLSVPYNATT